MKRDPRNYALAWISATRSGTEELERHADAGIRCGCGYCYCCAAGQVLKDWPGDSQIEQQRDLKRRALIAWIERSEADLRAMEDSPQGIDRSQWRATVYDINHAAKILLNDM